MDAKQKNDVNFKILEEILQIFQQLSIWNKSIKFYFRENVQLLKAKEILYQEQF